MAPQWVERVRDWFARPKVRAAERVGGLLGTFLLFGSVVGGLVRTMLDFPAFWVGASAVGAGLLAMSVAARRLGVPPEPTPASTAPLAQPSPLARASELENEYRAKQAVEREDELKLRRAARRIREELLDNRHALELVLGEDFKATDSLKSTHWQDEETTLLEHDASAPHAKSSQAYRELMAIWRSQYKESDIDRHLLERDYDADQPLETDIHSALGAIDAAVTELDAIGGAGG